MTTYTPTDELFVWWLGEPNRPLPVGTLRLVRAQHGGSLQYTDGWLEQGFPLSEDLPLNSQEFFPREKGTAAGAIDDARPDRWGERVIKFLDKPPRLSLLEYLYFAGDDRFGALGISTSPTEYVPRRLGPLPQLADVSTLYDLVQRVLANETIPEDHKRLIAPGGTMGGARPKALVEIDGHPWVVKFDAGEANDTPLIEHATMTLAKQAGICAAETRPIRLPHGHAVAVKRFDRINGRRRHAISANVALKAAGEELGYPELAQLLRRRGIATHNTYQLQMHELFRRMIFNILMDNTDDHEKNHALLMTDAFEYELAPAYDVLPSGQAIGFQQMRVGTDQADSTLSNAMSMCSLFGLSRDKAASEVKRVIAVVSVWRHHFVACGLPAADIEALVEQIDRPFLAEQRDAW